MNRLTIWERMVRVRNRFIAMSAGRQVVNDSLNYTKPGRGESASDGAFGNQTEEAARLG